METKGFKRRIGVDADDFIFQEALNKLKGGFRKKLPKTPKNSYKRFDTFWCRCF